MRARLAALAVVVVVAAPARAWDPPADADCVAFARKIEQAIHDRDPGPLEKATDVGLTVERAVEGVKLAAKSRDSFTAGARKGHQLPREIVKQIGEQGSFKFLRVRKARGDTTAVFRMLLEGGGFTYYEPSLAKGKDGQVVVADTYVYNTGEKLSATLRRTILAFAAEEDKGLIQRLVGQEGELVKSWPKVQRLIAAMQGGRWKEALDVYDALPESVRKDRMLVVNRIKAAQMLDEETYMKVLEEAKKLFGSEPAFAFTLLDYHLLKKDYPKALEAVASIDEAVGGDPFLHYQRAAIYELAKKLPESLAAAKKAFEAEPDLLVARWHAIGVALELKDWAEVKRGLEGVEKQGVELADLEKVEGYGEFVKTKEYAEWQKARAKK